VEGKTEGGMGSGGGGVSFSFHVCQGPQHTCITTGMYRLFAFMHSKSTQAILPHANLGFKNVNYVSIVDDGYISRTTEKNKILNMK
jgi:hypothetical protein